MAKTCTYYSTTKKLTIEGENKFFFFLDGYHLLMRFNPTSTGINICGWFIRGIINLPIKK